MTTYPAILTDSFLTLQEQVALVKDHPALQAIQIDIVDGQFSDTSTVTPLDLTVADFAPAKIDFHLMTEEPMDFVYECEAVKEYLPIRRIYGQVERMTHQEDFLWSVKANQWQAGLALDLFTPIEAIEDEIWPHLQYILIMAVEAGVQHETFKPIVTEKITQIRQKLGPESRLHILIDGGMTLQTAAQVHQAGANEVAVGSALWQSQNPLAVFDQFVQLPE